MMNDRFLDSSDEDASNCETKSLDGNGLPGSSAVWKLLESIKQDPSLAELRAHHDVNDNLNKKPGAVSKEKEPNANKTYSTSATLADFNICLDSCCMDTKKNLTSSRPEPETRKISDGKVKPLVTALADDQLDSDEGKESPCYRYMKLTVLLLVWLLCTHQISVVIEGALLPNYYANLSTRWMTVWVEMFEAKVALELSTPLKEKHIKHSVNVSEFWTIPLVLEELVDIVPELSVKKVFNLKDFDSEVLSKCFVRIHFETNLNSSFPVSIGYDLSPIDMEDGVIYATIVLLGLYIFIIFEVVHRTLAAMLAATMSVAILAALDERPSIMNIASWIDFETLLLLFSMMVMVGIFAETGIFDYLSVYTYRITNGRIWPLINTLCFFTGFLSSFLDNVTTALLMTPVTIRQVALSSGLATRLPVLMAVMIFSNIGGAMTPVGDPPNVIVASHPDVINAGVDFGVFVLHMFIGVALVTAVVYCQLRYMFRNNKGLRFEEPQDVQELRHEIAIWQRAAASLTSYSKDEDVVRETLLKKVRRLLTELKLKLVQERTPCENYKANLEELTEKYPIRNWPLLYKSSFALLFVICVFFLHSIPELNLSLGCTAFLGAALLLILADRENIEGVLARVEWSTLLFFASLFILMEALSRLRLIEWIGRRTEYLILAVDTRYQLSVAIIIILWVSAWASAFIDNIPLTTMMIRIVTSLAQNPQLDLPLMPLVWALCFGACLGGVATLIGSSSNVVCAGVAEQHGYRFTFIEYFKVGFPVMIVSVTVCTVYLLIAHVALEWNT
ncbi:hypothetical protein RUM44_001819 [Polyplax serrata]|uniref:Citrate transporter-like domain-containing protein n=1 Tax=Polyplax serrata TaxID=468196 RepID=A0ABR1ALV0_POLSC